MKIKYTMPCEIDVDACDLAEVVANSDATEQANFFEHLAYELNSFGVMEKDTQLSYIVEEIFMNNEEDDVKKFLEQMLGWFDYYEKEFSK